MGGVNLDTADAFLKAGAYALGVGSGLFDPKLAQAGQYTELRIRASKFIEIAAQYN